MSAALIDGKAFAANLRARVGAAAAELKAERGITPGLAVVLVGEDPASAIYVRNKGTATREAGMNSWQYDMPAETGAAELLARVDALNADPAVHGILVQLPLPAQIPEPEVIARVSPDKDVDGFHVQNAGRLMTGLPGLVPCTPLGCLMLIQDRLGPDFSGLNAVVVGRSNIVGKPMAQLLLRHNATVTIAHSRTPDLPEVCRRADILVAAVGKAEMVRGDWIKPGAVVIDVGINRIPAENGKTRLVGDVCFPEAAEVAGAITPVPGGVGPMTIAVLLRNTLTAACLQAGIEPPKV